MNHNAKKKLRRQRRREPMGVEYCDVCTTNVTMKDLRTHNLTPTHISNVNTKYSDSSIVQVRGMGPNLNHGECHKFFSAFGTLKKITILGPRCPNIKVQFKKYEDARNLRNIKQPIFYKGNQLLFWAFPDSKLRVETKSKTKTKFVEMSVPEAFALGLRGDFKDQLQELMTNIRLRVMDIQKMASVCGDLENTLRGCFPNCQITPFGSVAHGMAFVDSDIDCYCNIDVSQPFEERDKGAEIRILQVAKKAFYRSSYLYKNIVFIPSAKVPIIKLRHIRAGIDVDINFKNPFGVLNSELVRHLFNSDVRILPFSIFIKYWAKAMSFIGINRFTSYGITLMIIFYLQKLPQPILPSVSDLQKNSPYKLGNWDAGFSKEPLPENSNTQSVLSLVKGFFEFYSSFEFDKYVICTLVGMAIPIENFTNSTNLPVAYESFINLVKNGTVQNIPLATPMLVQDPFELNKNCTHTVNSSMLENFIFECRASAEIIKNAEATEDQHNLIVKLTSCCKLLPEFCENNLFFYIPINMNQVQIDKESRISWANDINKDVKTIVDNILSNVARCKLESSSCDQRPNSRVGPINSFDCQVYYDLWSNRSTYNKSDGVLTTSEEINISSDMFNTLYADNKTSDTPIVSLNIIVSVDIVDKIYDVNIKTNQDIATNDIFYKFVNFIVPIIERDLRRHSIH